MASRFFIASCLVLLAAGIAAQEMVTLKATADIGVSNVVWQGEKEGEKSWGQSNKFKLKTIQEMGVVRFDTAPVRGREVKGAVLFLHRASKDRLRYMRVSTVNNDWNEGATKEDYGPPNGACFNYADWDTKKWWAWPGSQLCDVILGAGHSLHMWTEIRKRDDGWVEVDLIPDMIYAMAVGDTDGLALQDGGTLEYFNNFIHSVQSGKFAPYIEVELGPAMEAVPQVPAVNARASTAAARVSTGTLAVTIAPDPSAFCYRLKLNGKPVPRWQVRHPAAEKPVSFSIEYLEPGQDCELEVIAVSRSGQTSETAAVSARASSALPVAPLLGDLTRPEGDAPARKQGSISISAVPPLVKIAPGSGRAMFKDMNAVGTANAVWDGRRVSLFGMRGEYVSFQLVIAGRAAAVSVKPSPLTGPDGSEVPAADVEMYKNWYAQNKDKKWQPAYCVPLAPGQTFDIPDTARGLPEQKNQTVYVDVYIPKNAAAGEYKGRMEVTAAAETVNIPLSVRAIPLDMPDTLAFWPQLNVYRMPWEIMPDAYKLAHQHRNVFFLRNFRPGVSGKGKDKQVIWDDYDKRVGPLLSGEAFKDNRRAGVPIEAISLPYGDSWPTELSKETYHYKGDWSRSTLGRNRERRKEVIGIINEHFMTAPYIADGLTQEYKDAFIAVGRQFMDHFKEKGWDRTECQCMFMGKNTHRIDYNSNMWWTTDEPYHWDDWLSLQFFARLWTDNRPAGTEKQWVFRADISRPQWQARTMDGCVDNIHFGTGAFSSPAMYRRVQLLARQHPFDIRVYGGANSDNRSNNESVVWFVNAWLHGANAALPWQTMGNDKSLDVNDASVGGNALIAPGKRLGVPVVADIRLKAFRDGEQLLEYLTQFKDKYKLTREQVKHILYKSVTIEAGVAKGAGADNADALRFSTLNAWEIAELRRALAKKLLER